MTSALKYISTVIAKIGNQKISKLVQDDECAAYLGYSFQLGDKNIKFRKAKITPKKVGQFVTLWKRNAEKETQPFDENDKFDFYYVVTVEEEKLGIFMFPQSTLIEQQILSTNKIEGKRGFRVYPPWVKPESAQAKKTQSWQTRFFINLIADQQDSK